MDDVGTSDDELFSMEDLEKDLKKGKGGRRWLWLLIGLVTGVAGTIAAPRLLTPYLPAGLLGGGDLEILSGPVLGEERSGERLLLTIETEPGALIASFSQRVDEIALLVDPGDVVTIGVSDYEPFVEDPDFEGVKKASRIQGGDAPTQRLDELDERADADPVPDDAVSSEAGAEPEVSEAVPDTTSAN